MTFVSTVPLAPPCCIELCLLLQAWDPKDAIGKSEEEQREARAASQRTAAPNWEPSPAPCYGALARALAAADFGERRAASSSPSSSSSGLGSVSGDTSPTRSASDGAGGRACKGLRASSPTDPPRMGGPTSNGAPLAERARSADTHGLGLELASRRAGEPAAGRAPPTLGPNSELLTAAEAEESKALRPFAGSKGQASGGQAGARAHFQVDQSFEVALKPFTGSGGGAPGGQAGAPAHFQVDQSFVVAGVRSVVTKGEALGGQAGAPAHFQVDQSFEVAGVGSVVAGTVVAGAVRVGQRLLLGPTQRGAFAPVTVTCIQRAQARLALKLKLSRFGC